MGHIWNFQLISWICEFDCVWTLKNLKLLEVVYSFFYIIRLGWVGFDNEECANQTLKNFENGITIKNT